MPRKTFADGDALPASDVNTFLMDQAVQTYANGVARTAALPSPTDGQVTTRADSKNLETYYGQYRPLPFAIENRNVSITGTGAVSATIAITWGIGKFTLAPTVFATHQTASLYGAGIIATSSTGATIVIRKFDGGSFSGTLTVAVLAIQLSNTSTTG
jgi:hypothetical protein